MPRVKINEDGKNIVIREEEEKYKGFTITKKLRYSDRVSPASYTITFLIWQSRDQSFADQTYSKNFDEETFAETIPFDVPFFDQRSSEEKIRDYWEEFDKRAKSFCDSYEQEAMKQLKKANNILDQSN